MTKCECDVLTEKTQPSSGPKMRIAGPFTGLEQIVAENVPLARHTWFRIGGPARWFVKPTSLDNLREAVLRCTENQIPIYVLGLGANLLISDEGVAGAVFRLDADFFRRVEFEPDGVRVGAGQDMQKLLLKCVRQGRAGIECLAGIPGTVGGGIRMNAGGKFGEIGAAVSHVTVMDTEGAVFERTRDDLVFEYRSTNISARFILDARLDLEEDDPHRVMQRTKEIWMYKRNSQPLSAKSAGCIFKNPEGRSAGALIDRAGLKGMRVGGAEISTKHANFIIAAEGCSSHDVMKLIKLARDTVYDRDGILLEPEVQIWP